MLSAAVRMPTHRRVSSGALLLAALVAVLAANRAAFAGQASAYQCYVSDNLTSGIVPNTIQALGIVDCSGYGARGTVTFTVRLKKWNAQTKTFRVIGTKAKRFSALRVKHRLAVSKSPCVPGAYRGSYTAVLRTSGGGLVSVNAQKLETLHVLQNCSVK